MAVIHPSPKKKKPVRAKPPPNFELLADQARRFTKVSTVKEVPEHLTRPPVEISSKKRTQSAAFRP